MFVFKHPKYYKELRKRNKSDQVISDEASTEATSVHPGPGLNHQAKKWKLNKFTMNEDVYVEDKS